MVDLVVPAGATLVIDPAYQIAARYGLFRMGTGSTIICSRNLILKADDAEFGDGCVILARGSDGASGQFGQPGNSPGANGGDGGAGSAGQAGYKVTIEAALTQVGGLTIVTDGGAGGRGGNGGWSMASSIFSTVGNGGRGGIGGPGGDGGQISLSWTRSTPGLPTAAGVAANGHNYHSNGGAGGIGGQGGTAQSGGPYDHAGQNGVAGSIGPGGKASMVKVIWRADIATLLWAQAQDMGPAPRSGHGLTFDPERGKLVLFGGVSDGKAMNDTWEWDGHLWTQVADTGPSPRAYHGMAFDPVGRRVLVFGGSDSDPAGGNNVRGYLGDTWGWDGEIWIQLADTGPSARQAPAMATDPVRKRVMLFGGGQISAQAANQGTADTWEWDGLNWAQLADTGPSERLDSKAAYDEESAVILLFGGAGAGPALSDTWAWDGQVWRQVADMGPSPRTSHAMASLDSAVILFGGQDIRAGAAGTASLNDTWSWQGGAWRQIQDMGPSPRTRHAMACVADLNKGDRVTLFGGQSADPQRDTWRLVERF